MGIRLSSQQKDEIRNVLHGAGREVLSELVGGAKADINRFAAQIAEHLVEAIAKDDQAWIEELEAQLPALAELNRIRAVNVSWDAVMVVLRGLVKVGIGVLSSAVV